MYKKKKISDKIVFRAACERDGVSVVSTPAADEM